MNNIAAHHPAAPQPLLPVAARVAAAAAVLAIVSLAWLYAGQASRYAVANTQAALTPGVLHVTLPSVEIVGHRNVTQALAAVPAPNSAQ